VRVRKTVAGLVATSLAVAAGIVAMPAAAATPPGKLYTRIIDSAAELTGLEVGGGRIYVGFAGGEGKLRVFDLASGAPRWEKQYDQGPTATPDYVNATGIVYVAHGGGMQAYNAATGASVRTYQGGGEVQINVSGNVIYSRSASTLRATDVATGALRWAVPASLIGDFDVPGDGYLYANESLSGQRCTTRRAITTGAVVRSSCTPIGSLEYGPRALTTQGRVIRFGSSTVSGARASDLGQVWSRSFSARFVVGATQQYSGRVAVSTTGGRVALYKAGTGAPVCNRTVGDTGIWALPEFLPSGGGFVTTSLAGNGVVGISATCQVLWRLVRSEYPVDDLVAVAGYLVVTQLNEISTYRL
jgi:hypothetical protein